MRYLALFVLMSCGGTSGVTCASGEPLVCGQTCASGESFVCGRQCAGAGGCEQVVCGGGQFPQCGCLISWNHCAG